ncbi:MAG: amino acid ABC transporter ATP-binding protein [Polyangia bacterium]
MIRVDALGKHFGSTRVLDGVSFELTTGTTAAILGQSGGGKSTLLRCLVGLEPFDEGTIRVGEAEVCAGREQAQAQSKLRGRVGLVFQSFELFANLTVLENCKLAPMRVRGVTPAAAEDRGRALLSQLGLAGKEHAYPDHLSGGQKQRVAIARALAMDPEVLLYDEPTSALDPSLKQEVRDAIAAVGKTGVTQIVVTHDVALAHDVAARVFLLERGKLCEDSRGGGQVVDIGAR